MPVKLGVVMDPIDQITINKDTTFAILLAAQKRGWQINYMEQHDLYCLEGKARARMRVLHLKKDKKQWYEFTEELDEELQTLDLILMRVDPPFNLEYIYTTYLLELAQKQNVLVVNDPRSLRDVNEKFFISWFPQCCPATIITRDKKRIIDFLHLHKDIIVKPLEGMGGQSIFRLLANDHNLSVVIETITQYESKYIMVQQYIPEIAKLGDKRILLLNGEAVPYALARIPEQGETRANLAVGGSGTGVAINDHDRWICQQVGPILKEKGLVFVGIDVIGNYLTEINVTSPTCIQEIEAFSGINICNQLLDILQSMLDSKKRACS